MMYSARRHWPAYNAPAATLSLLAARAMASGQETSETGGTTYARALCEYDRSASSEEGKEVKGSGEGKGLSA